ncbi:glycine betaine/L-proline ABC transporter ATP-binding protein [Marinilactibacillus psychrotolerans]|uniref:Quaternary amine transport ATP-binding protein n=2 Tax=Marinilactibacillus psychrotolerans TaxID=191770 RepID=A0A511GYQ6_9LACT|nr:glycine betaine/L-proline ABC transporter ATP-binding protein [Marinilactibacillus psychrotolerans]TLQ06909.1 glycine betaine/L-proline ABC transporter ATP-binding protein [Marinilactibacillus psychrotolerans]SDD16801.1 glycine betaine/proline transport system ATP-binding protein [Marinilactibacillus psychrotolerans]SJN29421.1 Glycine betaine ABC transport system, ATP-binding protein OpuAA [Marinilactibacillus psychrotolerans 42ea]GEL66393.1 glycine/betaine ABC transporter ATP-binding protei
MTTKVEVQNLVKIFGKKEQQALELVHQGKQKDEILQKTGATVGVNQASFEVQEGEIFVIMGLSGSGKSTLVRMLNRLIEPTEGNILIDGDDISKMEKNELRKVRREKVSMVFQNFGLFPHRTILENTEYGLEVQGIDKEERQKKAEQALDNAGLLPYKDQHPNQLSGGMQQRVGLARALANDPEILLMDEAFSALDPLIRRDMQDELLEMQEKMHKTIIFITHDLNESLRIGDRIAIMKDGEVVQVGTGEEILTNPANDYVERFVEDVDRSKVLTAENIMARPQTVRLGQSGPRVALNRMRTESLSSLLVVGENQKLLGYVVADDAARLVKENITSLESIIRTDIPKVSKETLIHELYDVIYEAQTPVAVVDDNDKLLGIVVRGLVIGALAKEREEVTIDGE